MILRVYFFIAIILLLVSNTAAYAKIDINTQFEYIELEASNPKSLLTKLKIVKSPISGDAYAWIHTDNQHYLTYDSNSSGCKLHNINSDLNITITLPQWLNVKQQTAIEQRWWSRLITFITDHELAHQTIIIEATRDFHSAVEALGVYANCEEVRMEYDELKSHYTRQIRDNDFKLDFTDGGRIAVKDFLFLDYLPNAKRKSEKGNR